jgi:hypothetical protein
MFSGLGRIFKSLNNNKAWTTGGAFVSGVAIIGINQKIAGDDKLPGTNQLLDALQFGTGSLQAQFPLDSVSGGDFWTEISFFSWKSSPTGLHLGEDDLNMQGVNTQTSDVKTDFLGIMRLPMPMQLATGYAGRFSEGDDMSVNRSGLGNDAIERISGIVTGLGVELKKAGNAIADLNNTAKMSNASINNNNMGMIYEGSNLRGHTFSWRLAAKSEEETVAIQKVIMYLKGMSLPANNWGGAEDFKQFFDTVESMNASTKGTKLENIDKKMSATAGGRLTIPPTCTVRFLDGDDENQSLFKIKDSFITNVEVNYTSQGTWNPHYDGSPMEVQLSITLKEVKAITRHDVMQGY